MAERRCRWGILGTANIARKNWQAIWNSGNGELVAVGSRNGRRAQQFIDECQTTVPFRTPPRVLGYDELLGSTAIDAVYIPLPTGIRKDWVIRAAEAGKHVLCEKPCGTSAADVEAMLAACRASNVQFMDGVMFMHSRRLGAIRQVLDEGQSVGRVKRIATQFSFLAPDEFLQSNIRVSHELEPLGCLGDLGWYNIRFILWVLNYQMPERVVGRLLTTANGHPDGVPLEFSAELFFSGGVSASLYCSFLGEHQQWAHVSGSRGHLQVNDFVLPYYGSESAFTVTNAHFDIAGCQFNMEDHTRRIAVRECSNNAPGAQETNLFHNFAALVLSGRVDLCWGEIALKTQQVTDACLRSAHAGGSLVQLSSTGE